eukprot:CAMPEP_0181039218 /NCGR_PEP_ID=MMETSP1070-20121207/10351_1 /TAXON_ID=265543 /ORGANISM="Minutocellus polymorphus, Strain NH13" /LENGTH=130 /DNA_ID=CAMNT_0023117053 /DNA_START=1507 /DNA_END=1899 /DNA_ORIENTATION=+
MTSMSLASSSSASSSILSTKLVASLQLEDCCLADSVHSAVTYSTLPARQSNAPLASPLASPTTRATILRFARSGRDGGVSDSIRYSSAFTSDAILLTAPTILGASSGCSIVTLPSATAATKARPVNFQPA